MKKIILYCGIFIQLIAFNNLFAQEINGEELIELRDLYFQEDIQELKKLLESKDYVLTKNLPEYFTGRTKHKNVYEFKKYVFDYSFKGSDKPNMLFDQLSFETLDMTDYKYVKMEFSIHCQSGCSSSIKEYLKWYYTVLENLKVEGNGIEGFEVFASDSIWMEKMDKPGLLTMQNLLNSMKVYETALDGRIYNIPFTTNVGSFTKDIPYSPIDCTVEEYFKRAKVKKKYNIPIKQRNGSYLIKVNIGGKIMEYIIDSGASLITITPSMEKYLIESKIIDTTSYLKPQRFELADGSIKEYKTVLIPWIGVNGIFVNNIIAAVSDNETTPLLGKSFFDNFSYWKIDNYSNNIELLKK